VTTNIEAIAVVTDRAREAADILGVAFEDDNGRSPFAQFVRGGQAGGSSSDDDGLMLTVAHVLLHEEGSAVRGRPRTGSYKGLQRDWAWAISCNTFSLFA